MTRLSGSPAVPRTDRDIVSSWLLFAFLGLACGYMFLLQPWGHDLWFHLHRLHEIDVRIRAGHMRSFFSEGLALGGGLPVYIYYSQWVYWPAEALVQAGASPLVALKAVLCLFIVVSCLGCYRLLRLHVDRNVATLGTVLYVTSNYFIGDVYARSAYAEFLSCALAPWLFYGVHRVLRGVDGSAGYLLILSAALMAIFHPLSLMNFGVAILAYSVFVISASAGSRPRIARVVVCFALALMLTAFYWLPAVVEKSYVLGVAGMPMTLPETFMSMGRYLKFNSVTSLGLVLSVLSVGVFATAVRPAAGIGTGRSPGLWSLFTGIIVYVLLTLPISRPVWEHLPLLSSNNFVWRLLFPLTLLLIIAVCVAVPSLDARWRRHARLRIIAGLAVAQAIGFVLWHTWDDISLAPMTTDTIVREVSTENARTSGWGIDEYRPNPRTVPPVPDTCAGITSVDVTGATVQQFNIAPAQADQCYRLDRYWNVRYAADLEGERLPIFADDDGYMVVAPRGRTGAVTLRFGYPAYARAADVVSGLTALLLVVMAGRRFFAPGSAASTSVGP